MLLFRSEEEIAAWCAAQQRPRGAVLTLAQVWQLAKVWYGNRMAEEYRGRTPDAVAQVFADAGLSGSFWQVG